ncbi:N-acetyl-alpha-D-glucosaminyl-diphospho-ditrans, octacis-undecaprenol 4-epimerase [Pseudomonas fluorescens]|nr:N-acetyl-alpha-D-glucosaminyl-diphospho-ditrans, octacis-undecaprenol 4-epimerase [Pseudomonas fluorescens]
MLSDYRKVNVFSTLNLASQSVAAGVKRFIFISSIKVNGEQTPADRPFTADDHANPSGAFAISKFEAELGLLELAKQASMEVVIIRPVLVYGPGVKANFLNLMRWLDKGIPLPLGAIDNRRSLVALDNLVSLMVTCIDHPRAANEIFLVSDGEDLSTTVLLQRLARALGVQARLLPIPGRLLKLAGSLIGRRDFTQRLCGSMQVDIEKTRTLLDWAPVVSVDCALESAAHYYQENSKK